MATIAKRRWNTNGEKRECWEIRYYFHGKQRRKAGFRTRKEAEEAAKNLTNSYSISIKVGELIDRYIENRLAFKKCKESSAKLYQTYKNVNLQIILNVQAKKLSAYEIGSLIKLWKARKQSEKYMNDVIKFLRSVYNFAIKNKWLSENPASDVDTFSRVKKIVKFLDEEDIAQFMNAIEFYPLKQRTWLYTAINTGMRISELVALEWSDIDFKNNKINIDKQFYRGKLSDPKTLKSTRKIYVPPSAMKLLAKLKQESKVMSKIVFCSSTGGYISKDKFIANYFKKAMVAIDKPEYNFHCLRHTYASRLLSHNVPLKFVQEQLGHSTPVTTMATYSHVMSSVSEQAMDLLEKLECEQNMSKRITQKSKKPLL